MNYFYILELYFKMNMTYKKMISIEKKIVMKISFFINNLRKPPGV